MPDSPQKHDIPEELLDQLLAQVDDPKELLGSGGLLRSLMGRLVEKSLSPCGHPRLKSWLNNAWSVSILIREREIEKREVETLSE